MQLILLPLLLAAAAIFVRFSFFALGCRHRAAEELYEVTANTTLNRIGNIGVSMILLAPRNDRAVIEALDTRYPASELIVTIDGKREATLLGCLIARYALIDVNHSHIDNKIGLVRGLYRSRRRAFHRLVVIDMLAAEHGAEAAKRAASYSHTMLLPADIRLENFAVGRMVAALAAETDTEHTAVETRLGVRLRLEPQDVVEKIELLVIDRPLARHTYGLSHGARLLVISGPLLGLAALATSSTMLYATAATMMAALLPVVFVSCRAAFSNSLFEILPTVMDNFYDDLVVSIKKISYLYLSKH